MDNDELTDPFCFLSNGKLNKMTSQSPFNTPVKAITSNRSKNIISINQLEDYTMFSINIYCIPNDSDDEFSHTMFDEKSGFERINALQLVSELTREAQRKLMRLFVTYEGERASMDIPVGVNVGKVKQQICHRFNIQQNNAQLGNESQMKTILVINYGGAELHEDWILSDLSISPGSTLKAYMKAEMDPILHFKIMYNQETVSVMEKLKLFELSTADLRSMASSKSGLPCSVFRMLSPSHKDMFDCHMVDYYDIKPGSIIRIETWDGWNEFLRLCTLGFTSSVFENINTDDELLSRFQMKVAMYIAAHFGHVDLAVSLCKHGIRPDEPIGQHPLRQWCATNQHIDNLKTPIHEAVECGQLGVLRSFVHQSITSIFAKDGYGLQPLNIALRRKKRSCASFLLTKQWSRIPYNGNSIPLAIFNRLKLWSDKAKDKVCLSNSFDKSPSKRKVVRSFPLVGQGVFIDGFSTDQISSRSKFPPKIPHKDSLIELYYQNFYGVNPEYYFKSLGKGHLNKSLSTSNRLTSISDLVSLDSDSHAELTSSDQYQKEKQLKFPKLSLNRVKEENSRSRSSSLQSNVIDKKLNTEVKATKANGKKMHSKSDNSLTTSATKMDTTIPLPLKSNEDTPRPFCYMGPHNGNEVEKTLEEYYVKRGYMPREYAIRCLSLTNKLKEKTWLAQVQIAMKLSQESVKKSLIRDRHQHSVAQQ